MQKLVIDLATPPGLTGAYVSQGSVCQNTTLSNAPCCCDFCQPISTSEGWSAAPGGAGDAFENSIAGCDGGNGGDSCVKSHPPGGDNGDDYSTGSSGISFAIALLGAAIMVGTLCFPITLQDLLADTFNVSPTASAALSNTLPVSFTIEEAAHPLPDVLLQQDNPMDWETSLRTSVELVGHGMSMPRRMVNIISVVGGVLDGVRN
ncbi:hypothetical protein CEUSTIGMA_g6662.t1 [Chlamydomonas eustigma]|uniref:Uncharacterized protein n=1 Tax=Chlamydomonas eustigma TaxID=1157962 RepID=A0A250X8K7_9CHLO|nr:hypothetical protein CEUSTIGMA_g6662.t1 [Chlamydomonas eustigma]|eukprot:GAX79222.1 hypothetical protein CEUSTIGMA_g6662.t1 [Chlamydomonas eustigma]